jgi:hypothetical protein
MKMKDTHETQISAFVSKDVKYRLEKMVRSRGLKKGFVIERALDHHLRALQEIPEEYIIPATLVVTGKSFGRLLLQLKTAPKPTSRLRTLMKGGAVPEDGLH